MADVNLDEIRDGVISKFRPGMREQVSRTSLLMERLYYGRGEKGGNSEKIRGAERYRRGVDLQEMLSHGIKPSQRTDGRTTGVEPTAIPARTPMKMRHSWWVANATFCDDDESANKTGDQIFNLIGQNIKDATEGMKVDVAKAIMLGAPAITGVPAFAGLVDVISADNVYGAINRALAENAWFRSKVITYPAGQTVFTLNKLDVMHDELTNGMSSIPTFQITTKELWREAVRQISSLYTYKEKDDALLRRGVEHIIINGSPAVSDINAPAGIWQHVNEDALNLYIDPGYDFKVGDWENVPGHPHEHIMYIKFAMVLYCNESRLHGKHVGFTIES